MNRIPFFAGADVDKVAWGIRLQGSFHLGGRHPKLKVLIVALFDAIDDFLRMNAIITLTKLLQCFFGMEGATGATADVKVAEQGPLRPWVGLQNGLHGGFRSDL